MDPEVTRQAAQHGAAASPTVRAGRVPRVPKDSFAPVSIVEGRLPAAPRATANEERKRSTTQHEITTPDGSPSRQSRCVSTRVGWAARRAAVAAARKDADPGLDGKPAPLSREELIKQSVDVDYYSSTYPDILARGLDPATHYMLHGWKEGRNPSRTFDTAFYLDTNPDVAQAKLNPLWHYVMSGREEGRRATRSTDFTRDILGALKTPDEKTQGYELPQSISVLSDKTLLGILSRLTGASCFVLSVGHDEYTRAVGGTQIFIADEQEKFARTGAAYLHVSPVIPRLRLASPADGPIYLRLILNGREIGFSGAAELSSLLKRPELALPSRRMLVCHCILGHRTQDLIDLHSVLEPERAVFWLHDYSSLCGGVNLLRNDVTFCGAPPPDSQACRVCINGQDRPYHVAEFKKLFAQVDFDVAAPSETAMRLWQARAELPFRSLKIHPHATIEFTSERRSLTDIKQRGTADCPIRVAFAGHPATHKGWQAFCALVDEFASFSEYRFFHFHADGATPSHDRIESVAVRVEIGARDSMTALLQAHGIDLVLMLSTWPETFSYVTHEAIAAGADVMALSDGGNVAAEVLKTGRGLVLEDFAALREFFVSGEVVEYVRLCYQQANKSGHLVHHGTTATLWPELGPDSKTAHLRILATQ